MIYRPCPFLCFLLLLPLRLKFIQSFVAPMLNILSWNSEVSCSRSHPHPMHPSILGYLVFLLYASYTSNATHLSFLPPALNKQTTTNHKIIEVMLQFLAWFVQVTVQ